MRAQRFVADAALVSWFDSLSAAATVLSPHRAGGAVVFAPYVTGEDVVLERATVPPKSAVMPAAETLFSFTGLKDADNLAALNLTLRSPAVLESVPPTAIVGARACDARGIAVLDAVYLEGPYRDPYYAARRGALTVVTQTCDDPCGTCFCHAVSEGPADPRGSDVFMTRVVGGFFLEALTDKGDALLAGTPALEDGTAHRDAALTSRVASRALMGDAPDVSAAPVRLKARFNDEAFWTAMTAKCLSCGACTYMCPTCQCFTITDEGDAQNGRRIRSWDSCMSPLFTREASGHNPRTSKAFRMRNRVSHKYWYLPETKDGLLGCTGCGRCIKRCPVAFDIREVVLAAIAE